MTRTDVGAIYNQCVLVLREGVVLVRVRYVR